MIRQLHVFKLLAISILILTLNSCGSLFYQATDPAPARLGEETASSIDLKTLPDPYEQIVVAVYKFRDQTGQYKPSDNGASWSTAVTQGGTSILLKALEDSGWFIPIERENVGNLLNERKIIRSSRAQYNTQNGNGNDKNLLPALLYAGVILEGGVVSYDANVVTGGAGLRYFGVGGSSQYRQDRVTVYLRAISTSNGKILKTVYTTKSILSQALNGGLFQFVQFRRLLEAEVGFTYNEPAELAVRDAIEKAVISLIIEGEEDGLWNFGDESDKDHEIIEAYKKERAEVPQTDMFGSKMDNRRGTIGLQIASASLLYKGDFPDPVLKTGGEIGLMYSPNPTSAFHFNYGFSRFKTKDAFERKVSYFELAGDYRIFPHDNFTPYLSGGLGLITQNENTAFDYVNVYPKAHVGAGLEYLITKNVGIRASLDYHFIFSDEIDNMEQGKFNDFYWRGNIGVNFYFGKPLQGRRKFSTGQGKRELKDDGF